MDTVSFALEELKVYDKSLAFVDYTYDITTKFPRKQMYGLRAQFTRAAVSIALNIAEGAGDTEAQFNRFLQIALNSSKERVVCATIAKRREYINANENSELRTRLQKLSKMITGLQKYLKNK